MATSLRVPNEDSLRTYLRLQLINLNMTLYKFYYLVLTYLLYVLTVYPAECWALRVRAHE